ncbi:hypothetical protein M9194_02405 [Vibrio sp. S4M6]|uniref:hypothetical protein n=1 Tax=Vibrio sinus TaxID=2946865 RepID=UPI00202A44C7|nr:hypothetical protein [Vibrio sinus]MCL9780282.1 hypothetical protein [Vibrio sinus]
MKAQTSGSIITKLCALIAIVAVILVIYRLYQSSQIADMNSRGGPQPGEPILYQVFGISSTRPLIITVPKTKARANIESVDYTTHMASGRYNNGSSIGLVQIDIETVLPLGNHDEKAYSAIVVLSDGGNAQRYYLSTFSFDPSTEVVTLVDSEWIGDSISVDAIESKGDLIRMEVADDSSLSNSMNRVRSVIVAVSDHYQLSTLKNQR